MLLKDDLQKLTSDNCILTLLCGRSSCGRQGQQLALKCLELKKKKLIILTILLFSFLVSMVDPVKCLVILLPSKDSMLGTLWDRFYELDPTVKMIESDSDPS